MESLTGRGPSIATCSVTLKMERKPISGGTPPKKIMTQFIRVSCMNNFWSIAMNLYHSSGVHVSLESTFLNQMVEEMSNQWNTPPEDSHMRHIGDTLSKLIAADEKDLFTHVLLDMKNTLALDRHERIEVAQHLKHIVSEEYSDNYFFRIRTKSMTPDKGHAMALSVIKSEPSDKTGTVTCRIMNTGWLSTLFHPTVYVGDETIKDARLDACSATFDLDDPEQEQKYLKFCGLIETLTETEDVHDCIKAYTFLFNNMDRSEGSKDLHGARLRRAQRTGSCVPNINDFKFDHYLRLKLIAKEGRIDPKKYLRLSYLYKIQKCDSALHSARETNRVLSKNIQDMESSKPTSTGNNEDCDDCETRLLSLELRLFHIHYDPAKEALKANTEYMKLVIKKLERLTKKLEEFCAIRPSSFHRVRFVFPRLTSSQLEQTVKDIRLILDLKTTISNNLEVQLARIIELESWADEQTEEFMALIHNPEAIEDDFKIPPDYGRLLEAFLKKYDYLDTVNKTLERQKARLDQVMDQPRKSMNMSRGEYVPMRCLSSVASVLEVRNGQQDLSECKLLADKLRLEHPGSKPLTE